MTKEEYFVEVWQRSMRNQGCLSVVACILVAFILMLSSCATKTRIEYRDRVVDHYNTVTVHDTLKIHDKDSVYHLIRVVNDTVYDTKVIEKTRWRDHVITKTDTCFRDSVQTEYKETVKEVVKFPKTYWYAVGFSILFFILVAYKLYEFIKRF